jgi:hypothetical protein
VTAQSGATPRYYGYEQLWHPDRECPIREQSFPNSPGKENPSGWIKREKAAHGSNDQGSKHRTRCKLKPHKDSTTRKVSKELANPQKKNRYESLDLRIALRDQSH